MHTRWHLAAYAFDPAGRWLPDSTPEFKSGRRSILASHAAAQLPFSLRETVGDATNPELAA